MGLKISHHKVVKKLFFLGIEQRKGKIGKRKTKILLLKAYLPALRIYS